MKNEKRIEFRVLIAGFMEGCAKYHNDADKIERGLQVLESFVDAQVDAALLTVAREGAKIGHMGNIFSA